MRRSIIPLLALLACLLAAAPSVVHANATDDRIARDCQDATPDALAGRYTKAQLRHARNNLPGDLLEYSGCYDTIQQALTASAGGGPGGDPGDGGTGGGSGSGFDAAGGVGGTSGSGGGTGGAPPPGSPGGPPAHTGTEAPVAIAGATIEPGELPSLGQDANELPGPLVALLVLLALAALVPAALTIGRRVVARRRA